MSHVPSAGMFNLGQKGSSSYALHITFYMLIDATKPRESFCSGRDGGDGERWRDGHREGVEEMLKIGFGTSVSTAWGLLQFSVSTAACSRSGSWISMYSYGSSALSYKMNIWFFAALKNYKYSHKRCLQIHYNLIKSLHDALHDY